MINLKFFLLCGRGSLRFMVFPLLFFFYYEKNGDFAIGLVTRFRVVAITYNSWYFYSVISAIRQVTTFALKILKFYM